MSNQEILGGLRAAIERGEPLKDAMMTFYQAGYDKYEIEEAARAYMNQQHAGPKVNISQRITAPVKEGLKVEKKEKKKPVVKKPLVPIKPKITTPTAPTPGVPTAPKMGSSKQKVSAYGTNKEAAIAGKTLTIALTLILLLLLGVLAAVFLFKDELITFVNNLFG